jgi:Asp-tRNA(Asn)/Glu-tRNA(Gln) amidotransferase A subunit family amidase
MPVGFQLCARPFGENALIEAAFALEQAICFDPLWRHGAGRPR